MINYKTLPVGDKAPKEVHAIIEVPKGERNKYEYDPKLGVFKLDRVLYSSTHYPTSYGFIPSTLAEDGDPLDVLVMTHGATFTGCVIDVRPIGLLKMRDDKGLDDKILSVPVNDPIYKNIRRLSDISPHLPTEIEHFFSVYKELEGKHVESFGWEDYFVAERKITESAARFLAEEKNGNAVKPVSSSNGKSHSKPSAKAGSKK
ncbi:MAG: inorganic diphosphatase [Chloroherpetonaceae bacterium]|nr:inorganic diphosphatase [Chloroherpetonaceae bacterium]